MKTTDQHVSDEQLDKCIKYYSGSRLCEEGLVKLLLELKQRRDEDRQREDDGK